MRAAIVALDKDVAARMAKLQLLGYQFKFWQSVKAAKDGIIWVTPYYPNLHRPVGPSGDIEHLADVVLYVWNTHVSINNGWPEAVHVAQG